MPERSAGSLALFTDLYELAMLQAYRAAGMNGRAVFTLSVRKLPKTRNFLLACGLDPVLDYLESLRFTEDDLDYLRRLGRFRPDFIASLAGFRFTGDVRAVPEGTPVFAGEPILELEAPIGEAQLVETFVINQVHLGTVLASKAARVVAAAAGRPVIDFGPRRMHGTDAALKAARAFHIAGVAATSNTLAGRLYGVPVAGTMAHSYVQACAGEADAFRLYAALDPATVLLIDTYDTRAGAERVVALARELGDSFRVRAVRIDSGDLFAESRAVRAILDQGGLGRVQIMASGGLDEWAIDRLVRDGAPIDGFGVGTAMGVADDAPCLDMAYKLVLYDGSGRLKLSSGKPVLPGAKQVFRRERDGAAVGDVIARADEAVDGRPLLVPVMRDGRRLPGASPSLEAARALAARELALLPAALRHLEPADPYPVEVSPALAAYQRQVAASWAGGGAP